MAGTVVADNIQAASTSTLVLKNGVASTPPTIQDSAGTQIGTFCRAWVNFNGTSTVSIRASFNVTSITDNGTGDYTVNFTTAMSDANYCYELSGQRVAAASNYNAVVSSIQTPSTTALRVATSNDVSNALEDFSAVCVAIFR